MESLSPKKETKESQKKEVSIEPINVHYAPGERKLINAEIKRCVKELSLLEPGSDEYIEMCKRIRTLKCLKKETNIDWNEIIKVVGIGCLGAVVMVVEIPGSLVNLRAVKVIEPIAKLIKIV